MFEYAVVSPEPIKSLRGLAAPPGAHWAKTLNDMAAEGWRFVGALNAGTMASVAVMERERRK